MVDRSVRTSGIIILLLLMMVVVSACGASTSDDDIATAIAATNAAETVVAEQVQQTVAALAPISEPQSPEAPPADNPAPPTDPNAPDVADPNSGITPIKPVADPNLAGGTPQLRVSLASVNVRSGPGTNYRVITVLQKDSVMPVIAKNRDGSWFLVELPDKSLVWIAGSVTEPVVAADMAKVVIAATIPAPPQPTATATKAATATATATPTGGATSAATHTPTPTGMATNAATHTPTATSATTATPTATTMATQAPTATPTVRPTDVIPTLPAPMPSVDVVNNTGVDICFLFIDLSSGPWTVDRLGNNILAAGQDISFSFPAGQYDMLAEDCNGTQYFNWQIDLTSVYIWVVQ